MMDEVNYNWRDRVRDSQAEGLAANEFFVIFTEPLKDRQAIKNHLQIHLTYQKGLEAKGILVAAGPISDEEGKEWTGKGLIIIRAENLQEARKIADADPMHRDGIRSYRLVPWLMNEGSFTLEVKLSAQKIKFS
jgi:uncharacterized protein YciI